MTTDQDRPARGPAHPRPGARRRRSTLADRIGIEPLTIRRLADELDVKPMTPLPPRGGQGGDPRRHGRPRLQRDRPAAARPAVADGDAPPLPRRHGRCCAATRGRPPLMESRTSPGPATLRHHDAVLGCLRDGGLSLRADRPRLRRPRQLRLRLRAPGGEPARSAAGEDRRPGRATSSRRCPRDVPAPGRVHHRARPEARLRLRRLVRVRARPLLDGIEAAADRN